MGGEPGRPGYAKQNSEVEGVRRSVPSAGLRAALSRRPPQANAIQLAVWWQSGKWYVGLRNEIGTDAACAPTHPRARTPGVVG